MCLTWKEKRLHGELEQEGTLSVVLEKMKAWKKYFSLPHGKPAALSNPMGHARFYDIGWDHRIRVLLLYEVID